MALLTLLYALNVAPLETIRRGFHDLDTGSVSISTEAIAGQEMLNITKDMLSNSIYATQEMLNITTNVSTLTFKPDPVAKKLDPVKKKDPVAESCPDFGFHNKWKKKLRKQYRAKLGDLSKAFPLHDVSDFVPRGSIAELAIQHALVWKDKFVNETRGTMQSYRKGGYYDLQKNEGPPLEFKPMVRMPRSTWTCPPGPHCPLNLMKTTIEIITEINKFMFVADVAFLAWRDMIKAIISNELAEALIDGAERFEQLVTEGTMLPENLPEIAPYDPVLAPFYRQSRDNQILRSLFESMLNRVDRKIRSEETMTYLNLWGAQTGDSDVVKFKQEVADAEENIVIWHSQAHTDLRVALDLLR